MNELQRTLISNGVGAPPAHVLEAIDDAMAHRRYSGVPHSIYEEVWHLAFWQDLSLDWIAGKSTPYPEHASAGFPAGGDGAVGGGAGAVSTRGGTGCGHRRRRGAARSLGRVPVARAGPATHDDGARADRGRGGAQRLPFGPGGAAAPAFWVMAAAIGWRYLVRNCTVWQR